MTPITLNEYTAINDSSLNYDANGNLLTPFMSGAAWRYTYDAQNRLTSASSAVTSMSASYDARNRFVSRTINGVTTFFYYDGWNLIEERDDLDAQLARCVHGVSTDELLARITPTTLSYYHYDALGSAVALTDANGNVTERYGYDVFGAPAYRDGNGAPVLSSSSGNRFLFSGRDYLSKANLYDYRNRTYSPTLGRFLQIDPLGFAGSNVNLYRYAGNSVANRLDPLGLSSCEDLCNIVSDTLSGLEARFDQRDALDDGDTNKWWDIQKGLQTVGNLGTNIGHNPAEDKWEHSIGSWKIALEWFWPAMAFARNPSEHLPEKTEWEIERQQAAAEWAADQIEDQGCQCDECGSQDNQ
jgi:RHS repeat-associated protein